MLRRVVPFLSNLISRAHRCSPLVCTHRRLVISLLYHLISLFWAHPSLSLKWDNTIPNARNCHDRHCLTGRTLWVLMFCHMQALPLRTQKSLSFSDWGLRFCVTLIYAMSCDHKKFALTCPVGLFIRMLSLTMAEPSRTTTLTHSSGRSRANPRGASFICDVEFRDQAWM